VIGSRLRLFFALTLVLTANLSFALDPARRLTQYAHTAWTVRDGYLPGGATSLAQTDDGYLWIGTLSGLVRFDGARFVRWGSSNGQDPGSSTILALLGARDGSLWIGASSGLTHLAADGKVAQTPLRDAVLLRGLAEDTDGAIFVTHLDNGNPRRPVCRVTESTFQCFGSAEGIPTQGTTTIAAIAADRHGGFWLGADTGLIHWNRRSSAIYAPKALKSNAAQAGVSAFATIRDGMLWAAISHLGVQHIVQDSLEPVPAPGLDTSKLRAVSVYADREDSLWIGTEAEGLYRITGTTVDHFDRSEGLSSNSVWDFFEDREGNLWVATTGGVDCFRDRAVANFTNAEGLGGNEADGVVATRDGSIWVSGSSSLDTIRHGSIRSIGKNEGLPGFQVASIMEDHQGRMWVGVENGLYLFQSGAFLPIRMPNGSPLGLIVGIAEDIENDVWVEAVGETRRLIRIHGLRVRDVISSSQVPAAHALAADPRGGIWLALMNGDLARYVGGKLDIIPLPSQSGQDAEQLAVDANGILLAATPSGLVSLHDGAVQRLSTSNGLPCNEVDGFISDHMGGFWLYTQCGLVRIRQSDLQAWREHPDVRLHPTKVLDAYDGVQALRAPFSPVALSSDGRLWFAYGNGVGMIDPARLSENKIPPPVDIEAVVADHKTYVKGQGLRLPPLIRDLEIDYTALSFVEPQKVYFRYKLEGRESDWRDAGTRRQAFYTDLAPGDYRFRVIACNNDGVWNEVGAVLDFQIAAAWYQTWWFRGLCAVAFIAAVWSLYALRLTQATSRIRMEEKARLVERERIARELHDTLLQGFQGLVLRFQSVLDRLPDARSRKLMEDVLSRADEILLEGRERIHDLRSTTTEAQDLSKALASFGQELADGRRGTFSLSLVGTPRQLAPKVFEEANRIGREALSNAFAHADASKIEAELSYDDEFVRLRVRDDGRGIDQRVIDSGKAKHWGLFGMRERADAIGGKLSIWSRASAGTEVELAIPAEMAYPRRTKNPTEP
jgi:signal transduction histidine kinase/ligand-binding sensor domain-containing protein